MGVVRTESFQRFQRMLMGSAELNSSTDAQAILRPEFREKRACFAGDMRFGTAPQLSEAWTGLHTTSKCEIMQDPVVPSKNRLAVYQRPWTGGGTVVGVARANSFSFPVTSNHYVFGGLVRPMKDHASTVQSGLFCCGVSIASFDATINATANSQLLAYTPSASTNLFSINAVVDSATTSSLAADPITSFSSFTDVSSLRPLKWNTDYFIEIEVDVVNNRYLVWVDDFLIRDSALPGTASAFSSGVSVIFSDRVTGAPPAGVSTTPFRFAVSDVYIVDRSDAIAPSSRLGMTTRVAGFSPTEDVAVEFNRPSGFSSNAEVVGEKIASQNIPSDFLSGDAAGTTDLYNSDEKNLNAIASLVYAVSIKSRYMNGSAAAHEVAAVLSDGAAESTSSYGAVAPASGLNIGNAIFHKGPNDADLTPATVDALSFGFKIVT